MKLIMQDNSTPKQVFWNSFVWTIPFSFFAIFGIITISYSDDKKNKLKWKGFFYGLVCNICMGAFAGGIMLTILRSPYFVIESIIGIIGFICWCIYVRRKQEYIIKSCGSVIEQKLENLKDEIEEERSQQSYQTRYFIEYTLLKNLIFQMPEDFKSKLHNESELKLLLTNLYKKIPNTNYDETCFEIYYSNKNIIVIDLPKTNSTGLCNMIGIIIEKNKTRFFAYTKSLVEWDTNNQRFYFDFNENEPKALLKFLKEIHNKSGKEQ